MKCLCCGKDIDKKSGDNYNDNYVSTQAHQGGE